MIKNTVRLATRGSALALWQAQMVADLLMRTTPSVQTELVVVSTSPDRFTDVPLAELGGDKGLFVKEVELAVLEGRADAAVHSLKDVPVDVETPGLSLAAFPPRGAVEDVLVSRDGLMLSQLPAGAVIGTGSARRQAQLRSMRGDLVLADIRGNVQTRLSKMEEGQYDALIMARAGLERLGLGAKIAQVFSIPEMLPAAGQGIVVVQTRTADAKLEIWRRINHDNTEIQALAEREFVRAIGADCHSAAGCYCMIDKERVKLLSFNANDDGSLTRDELDSCLQKAVKDARHFAHIFLAGKSTN